jgi:hypothetical protein
MIQKFLALLLLISPLVLIAQDNQIPVNEKTQLAEYTNVVSETGTSAELYERAITWISSYYKNPTNVVKTKEEGVKITGKSRFKIKTKDKKGNTISQSYVNYTFLIEIKDNKYRYVIDKINWQQPSYFDVSKWEKKDDPRYQKITYPSYVEQTVTFFNDFLDALEAGMATKKEEESSDW